MKKFLLAFFLSTSAFAATDSLGKPIFAFTFSGHSAGRFTMVACDYAESVARNWMDRFGAKDFDVSCTGGIQPTGAIAPLDLRIAYTPPIVVGQTRREPLVVESNPFPADSNCDFDSALMRALLSEFKNIGLTRAIDTCFEPQSPYHYDLTILRPQ